METKNGKMWLTEKEVSELTSIPVGTLQSQRARRTGFPYYKIGHHVRYSKKELLSYIEARKITLE